MGKSILISVTNDLNNDQRMLRISQSLHNAGYKLTLIGREKSSSRALQTQEFEQKRFSLFFEKGKLFYLEYNFRLLLFALFHRFDIYYAVDLDTILPMTVAANVLGKKRIYDAHEYFTEVPELTNRKFSKKVWDWVGRICIPQADLAFTVGEALAEQLQQHYQKPFAVVRNVPSQKNISNDWPEILPFDRRKFLLYQGALNQGRGISELLDIMQGQSLPLVIAGEGDLSEILRAKVKALKLEGKVFFLGMLSPDDLSSITQHSFIGFNLLENLGKSYYYSLANKFFDYIQAGVPCITMDFPEYRKINEQYDLAVLIPNLDDKKISTAIDILAVDSEYYAKLQKNAKHAAQQFNWKQEEQHLLSLIHGI